MDGRSASLGRDLAPPDLDLARPRALHLGLGRSTWWEGGSEAAVAGVVERETDGASRLGGGRQAIDGREAT